MLRMTRRAQLCHGKPSMASLHVRSSACPSVCAWCSISMFFTQVGNWNTSNENNFSSKILSRPISYLHTLTPTAQQQRTAGCNGMRVGPGAQNLQYLRNGARQNQGYYDGLIETTHLWLVPKKSKITKSVTLNDLERPKRHSCRNKSFTEPNIIISTKIP